jgi:twinkle protein
MKAGKTELMNCILTAEPYPVEGIHYANSRKDELTSLYYNGYPDGAKTGWKNIDDRLTFYEGTLTTITGFPSHGKSNFVDELMLRLCIKNGWKFGVFSVENGKIEIHLQRLCEILIGKPLLPNYNGQMTKEEKDKALEFINENIFFILPDKEEFTLSNIMSAASYLVLKHGIKGMIIDPWNCILHDFAGDTETRYIEKTLNKLTYFERDKGIHLFLVAHPAKPLISKSNKPQPPDLYSISGSANWFNKSEIGITVWREFDKDLEMTKHTQIKITKTKHKFIGRTGSVLFDFDVKSQRFYEQNQLKNEKSFLDGLTSGGYPSTYDLPEPVEYFNEPKEKDENDVGF